MNLRPSLLDRRRTLGLVAASVAFLAGPALADDGETYDVLLMQDGRELIGQIIEDRGTEVVFEFEVNGIPAKMTFAKSQIARMLEDQIIEMDDEADEEPEIEKSFDRTAEQDRTFGVRRAERRDGVPAIYVIPWRGQTGTDVNAEVYRDMIEDIKFHDPDYIVIEVECEDFDDALYDMSLPIERSLMDLNSLDMYRRVMDVFHDDLRDYEQVVWIKESVGISTVLTLAWDTIYMRPGARFEGAERAAGMFLSAQGDADKLGKFREAFMGLLRGFALRSRRGGGYRNLVDAMLLPEERLSASWKGREVEWTLDTNGEYTIDGSDKRTVRFDSTTAENFGISSGTAENMDDVALLLGLREYDVIDGDSEEIFEGYVEDWRRVWDRTVKNLEDYQKHLGWAQGDQWLAYFSKAKRNLESVVRAIEQYNAVEVRLAANYGIQKLGLEIQIEIMEEQIAEYTRAQRQRGRGGSRRGAPGGIGAGG